MQLKQPEPEIHIFGAVSHSIVEGLTLTEACRFATKCSAVTVCRYGAQPSMPTLEEVM